jgi:hypothetical protein
VWVERLLQDGLDGSVVGVAVRQRSLAGGVPPYLAVRFGQADDPLALPQMVQVVAIEQLLDRCVNVWSELRGLVAAPGWRALKEGRLLRRVVVPIGLPLARLAAQVRLGQLRSSVEANNDGGDTHIDRLADVAPRN